MLYHINNLNIAIIFDAINQGILAYNKIKITLIDQSVDMKIFGPIFRGVSRREKVLDTGHLTFLWQRWHEPVAWTELIRSYVSTVATEWSLLFASKCVYLADFE